MHNYVTVFETEIEIILQFFVFAFKVIYSIFEIAYCEYKNVTSSDNSRNISGPFQDYQELFSRTF